jgi:hypothetical protein
MSMGACLSGTTWRSRNGTSLEPWELSVKPATAKACRTAWFPAPGTFPRSRMLFRSAARHQVERWRNSGVRSGRPRWPALAGVHDMLETIILIVLILLLIGALPAWPHSRSWGYYPSGGLGLILIIIIILLLLGRV